MECSDAAVCRKNLDIWTYEHMKDKDSVAKIIEEIAIANRESILSRSHDKS